VVATQVMFEGSKMEVYAVGQKAMDIPMLFQAYDMTVEAVVTKLMWLLGQTEDPEEIYCRFYEPVNRDISFAL